MRWVVPAVIGFFILAFLGFFVLATGFEERASLERAAYSTTYAAPYSVPVGAGPEWDKFRRAADKGPVGHKDLQALMLSTDDGVAISAGAQLLNRTGPGTADLFFEQLPKVSTPVKESVRGAYFDPSVFATAAQRVKERDPESKEGAMMFLKLSYMRDGYGPEHRAFETLVSAIPEYGGAEADELAYTISLFRPKNGQPLVDMLEHEKPRARQTAAVALGKMGREDALSELKKLRSDPNSAVRKAALKAEKNIEAATLAAAAARRRSAAASVRGTIQTAQARENAKNRLGMP